MFRAFERRQTRRRVANSRSRLAGERPDPSRDEGTDCLPQIRHIVVLMMENHSYDNYLGMLAGRGDGLPLGPDGQPVVTNPRADASPVPLKHLPGTTQLPDVPSQSWRSSHIQWNEGKCDGFVRSIEETAPGKDPTAAMRYWTEEDLPFYYGLARTFPLATRWFSSCLGPTFPNRRFLIAGTAHGLIDDLTIGLFDYPEAGTIFDLLGAHHISWVNYHNVAPLRIHLRRLLTSRGMNVLRILAAVFSGVFPALRRELHTKLQATADLYPLGALRSINHLRDMRQFFTDARDGTLPSVSIVDPDFEKWSEENPQDIRKGEAFASQVINAVMNGKGWPGTLLIWCYDEHGGYCDHVPPPRAVEPDGVPAADPMHRFPLLHWVLRFTHYAKLLPTIDPGPTSYDRLGFRVPAVIVSPYAKANYVSTTTYDHTSILKLIETKWNLPPLTPRDAAATAPLDAIDLSQPPPFLTPPKLPHPATTLDWT